jgi:DNA invertase Pin-like site-specific DNA recombinase
MLLCVYGYGQASFDVSVPSTADQEAIVRDAFSAMAADGRLPADAQWAGFSHDDAAPKPVKFLKRPAGSLLAAQLAAGDVLIAAGHDRIFTSIMDACETLELLHAQCVRLILPDLDLDTGQPAMLLKPMTAMMKNLKSRERRRTKEEFDYRKRQGMPAGGRTPIGWELVRAVQNGVDRASFVPDRGARRLAEFIAEHYDRWAGTPAGTFIQMAQWLNSQKVFRLDGKPWRTTAVFNWYHAAKEGFPLPSGRHDASPIPIGATPARRTRYIVADE